MFFGHFKDKLEKGTCLRPAYFDLSSQHKFVFSEGRTLLEYLQGEFWIPYR